MYFLRWNFKRIRCRSARQMGTQRMYANTKIIIETGLCSQTERWTKNTTYNKLCYRYYVIVKYTVCCDNYTSLNDDDDDDDEAMGFYYLLLRHVVVPYQPFDNIRPPQPYNSLSKRRI